MSDVPILLLGNGKSAWRLESRALPPGWGPRRLREPGAFIRIYPDLTRFPDSRFFGHLLRTPVDLNDPMSALS